MASPGPVEIEMSLGQPIQTGPQHHPKGHIMEIGIFHLLWFLLIGLAAGWLAGQILKGGGFGLWGDLIVGVIGALLGGFLFGLLGISAGGAPYAVNPRGNVFLICFASKICFFVARKTLGGPGGASCFFRG